MNLPLFFSTTLVIFLAELGDKTQLAILATSTKEHSYVTIISAAVVGFAAATIVAVVVGSVLGKFIPLSAVEKLAGTAFIVW